MSHFSVAVISEKQEDIEKLLAPYQENNMDDCPKEFLEFINVEEDYIDDFKNLSEEELKEYPTFEKYMEDYHGYEKDDQTNKYGYWENPNRKWDWWQVGGRYSNLITRKDGHKVDSAKIKDIDFSPNKKEYDYAIRFWEINVEGQELKDNEDKLDCFSLYKPEYYIERYETKERYAESMSKFRTWALITPDGKWYEQGKMGWFAMSDATKESIKEFEDLLNSIIKFQANEDYYMTIVDCHI